MTVEEGIKEAEKQTNIDPTEQQKEDGNYRKGRIKIKDLTISIENPKGSTRTGTSPDGKKWSSVMPFSYGFIEETMSSDGDEIDVYLGPNISEDFEVYIINQVREGTREFDEHKVMFGFASEELAHQGYLDCYQSGWTGLGNIITMSIENFKLWLKDDNATKRPAMDISMKNKSAVSYVSKQVEDGVKIIQLYGEVVEGKTLKNLQKQAGDLKGITSLVIEIASPGGSVSEGLEIMVWFEKLSQMGIQIITCVTANAYSIASLIMLAADVKLISKHGKVMVHNPMVPELSYANASELEAFASELRSLEATMYDLYQIFTELEKSEIKRLMDNETYLSPNDAVNLGFADMVVDIKPKSFEMTLNNKKEINMSKTVNVLNKVIGMLNKSDFVNQMYYDANGGVININQTDPANFKIGDRTDVEKGEVAISDGSVLSIENFQITDIVKGTSAEFNEGPAPEKTMVEGEEAPVIIPEEEAPVIIPEVAPEPEAEVAPTKGKDEMPAKVVEVVESTVTTKETVAKVDPEAKVEPEAKDDTEMKTEVEAKIAEDAKAACDPENKAKEVEPEMVEKSVVDKTMVDYENRIAALENKFKAFLAFENKATEAIDLIAENTVSNFKPEAKAKVKEVKAAGSIFSSALKSRGLKK